MIGSTSVGWVEASSRWAGVDVGGRRKGFHLALLDGRGGVTLARSADPAGAAELLGAWAPAVIGIDSPCSAAPDGERSREGERLLARAVCGIRWTPDLATLASGNPYFEWVVHGLELYDELTDGQAEVVEVFPTASWTRWHGLRSGLPRTRWSAEALASFGLDGLPARTNQDIRDSIGAALTARVHWLGRSESFGSIVVPAARR